MLNELKSLSNLWWLWLISLILYVIFTVLTLHYENLSREEEQGLQAVKSWNYYKKELLDAACWPLLTGGMMFPFSLVVKICC